MARAKALADPVTMPIRRDNVAIGFMLSVALHAAIIGSFYLSWPFMKRETPIPPPLIVDLVPIDEITAAPPPPAPKAEEEPKPETQPEPTKPDEATPPEEMPPEPEAKPEPKPEPPKPEPEPEKKPPPITPPPPEKPKPPKKKDDLSSIDKLLKDLQKKQPQKPQSTATPAAPTQATGNQAAAVSDRATMTELDAIRHHFESCWRIDPGKEGIENLSAEIRVFIGLDGSVQRAEILDMTRYFADAPFRTFANSARIAVLGCSGVPITPDHYDQLKEMVLNFSPQGRIN